MRRYLLLVFALILIAVIFATDFFIKKAHSPSENLTLQQENQDLRAQIERYSIPDLSCELLAGNSTSTLKAKHLPAKVFSTYPFNVKNEITINVGWNQGVKDSMVVTAGRDVLVGRVENVFYDTSLVQTIFDPRLELPARIGDKEVDSLFQGGSDPKVALIDKTKTIRVGDFVYSAGSSLPYGLKIGEIADLKENTTGVFKEAILKVPFNIGDLRDVDVIISNQ